MRAFDFAPLYRSTVGFDRMFSMLDQWAAWKARRRPIRPTISSGAARTRFASRSQLPALPALISPAGIKSQPAKPSCAGFLSRASRLRRDGRALLSGIGGSSPMIHEDRNLLQPVATEIVSGA
jgi:hypothetical protein